MGQVPLRVGWPVELGGEFVQGSKSCLQVGVAKEYSDALRNTLGPE